MTGEYLKAQLVPRLKLSSVFGALFFFLAKKPKQIKNPPELLKNQENKHFLLYFHTTAPPQSGPKVPFYRLSHLWPRPGGGAITQVSDESKRKVGWW